MVPRWNGERCQAQRVTVIVADAPQFPKYWARNLVGKERFAVEVNYHGDIFYIDNEDGSGWAKVIEAFGSPMVSHKGLEIEKVTGRMMNEW